MPSLFEYQCRIATSLLDTRLNTDSVSVHRVTVLRTLLGMLQSTFRTVQRLIGAAAFERIATRYISESPPQNPILNQYGGSFPQALALALPESRHLENVAQFDFLVDQVSRDLPAGLGARIGLASGTTVRLEKSLQCAEFDYPVDAIRESVNEGRPDAQALLNSRAPRKLAIWRTAAGVSVACLSRPAYVFVEALSLGHRANEALLRASEQCTSEAAVAAIREEVLCSPLCRIAPESLCNG